VKILFVFNQQNFYGGELSLSTLIDHLPKDIKYSLIFRKIPFRPDNIKSFRNRFPCADSIKFLYLPSDIYWWSSKPIINRFKDAIKNILWYLHRRKYSVFLQNSNFNLIHLNSYLLGRMITDNFKTIYHVRTMCYNISRNHVKRLAMAFPIFIDNVVAKPFWELGLLGKVIGNPIDIPEIDREYLELLKVKYPRLSKGPVFGVFGFVSKNKGVIFILKTFLEYASANATLIIIGDGNYEQIQDVRKLVDDRLIYIEKLHYSKMGSVYNLTDYLIRGEDCYQIGRTVYEALQAGSHVIIPGTSENLNNNPRLKGVINRLVFYKPRDGITLGGIITNIENKPIRDKNNVDFIQASVDSYLSLIGYNSSIGVAPCLV